MDTPEENKRVRYYPPKAVGTLSGGNRWADPWISLTPENHYLGAVVYHVYASDGSADLLVLAAEHHSSGLDFVRVKGVQRSEVEGSNVWTPSPLDP